MGGGGDSERNVNNYSHTDVFNINKLPFHKTYFYKSSESKQTLLDLVSSFSANSTIGSWHVETAGVIEKVQQES